MNPPRSAKGFTLVELSIALVIIALLLGGMIVGGSSVMESAKISSLIGQIKDLSAASREFKTRYGYYPGDLPNAAIFITADGGISAGCSYPASSNVGNGIVDTATESACALEHLVKARLLNKAALIGGSYVIQHPFGGGNVSLSVVTASNENAIRVTGLPCSIALQIDSKMDNAAATPLGLGFVTGWDSSIASIATCAPGGANDPVPSLLIRY
jgi:prepilin-type N-terminal cleavage/methylation domain-containing protein